ncbi:cutinase [Colletotrichum higginsianum]|nr:cutinase [Colletotrichum higginsianum]
MPRRPRLPRAREQRAVPGRQGKLVTAICDGLDSCDYEDIQFWNPLESPYCQSVEEGAANGTAQITAYNKRCPDAKLVVSGYSQGAHIVGDVLGGGGGTFFQECKQKTSPGLDATKAPGNKIAAALIFGDTRHTANQPYNYLSGAGVNGLFPRPEDQLAGMRAFANVTRSYCVDSDPICAGGDTAANHLNYFDIYSGEAGKWVQEMRIVVHEVHGSEQHVCNPFCQRDSHNRLGFRFTNDRTISHGVSNVR